MSKLGDLVKTKRIQKGYTKRELALLVGISHTEIHRIETGERREPSWKVLMSIGKELDIPKGEILAAAGYEDFDITPSITNIFPGIKTEKQEETLKKVADLLSISPDLTDNELDKLVSQAEMYIEFAKKSHN